MDVSCACVCAGFWLPTAWWLAVVLSWASSLRKIIGMVPQDCVLFNDTIRYNSGMYLCLVNVFVLLFAATSWVAGWCVVLWVVLSLRKVIGMVPQDCVVFNDTIATASGMLG
jgi:hypothetical protein